MFDLLVQYFLNAKSGKQGWLTNLDQVNGESLYQPCLVFYYAGIEAGIGCKIPCPIAIPTMLSNKQSRAITS